MIKPTNISPYFITRPLKKLPKILIYQTECKYSHNTSEIKFIAFRTDKPKKYAIMYCESAPAQIYRKDLGMVPSLHISYLNSFKHQGLGLGTALINIAKIYSKQIGANGFVDLYASSKMNPHRPPHIFYRKLGFNTGNISIDKRLDKYIKLNKNADEYDFTTEKMYYPPISSGEKAKVSLCTRIIYKLLDYFKM